MADKDLEAKEKMELQTTAESTRDVPSYIPAVDIYESAEALTLVADMPGVGPESVAIDVHDNHLTLRGTVTAEGEKERVLIHANLGFVSTRPEEERRKTITTWGIGAQIRLIGGLHSVSEIFYGDPYSGEEGGAFQVGFRHFISENIQVDATVGSGLWGSPRVETFVGFGFRIVFDHLW